MKVICLYEHLHRHQNKIKPSIKHRKDSEVKDCWHHRNYLEIISKVMPCFCCHEFNTKLIDIGQ